MKIITFDEVIQAGRQAKASGNYSSVVARPDDVFMFSYTSGTTGDPKAAMLSHGNLLSSASAVFSVGGGDFTERDTMISYLPLAHSFEKCLF